MAEVAQLPAPISDNWDWQVRAACRGLDASVFFHPDNERGAARLRRETQAKAICESCPVRQRCLDWALSVREPSGVWGGKSAAERDALLTVMASAS